MTSSRLAALAVLAACAVAGCTSGEPPVVFPSTGTSFTPASSPAQAAALSPSASPPSASSQPATSPSPVPGLIIVRDPGQVTGTLRGPCHAHGQLPDHACTPGGIDITITAAKLCSGHYSTKSYRPPESQTARFKYDEAYPAYGIPRTARTELDHLVSLELGGDNDAANLWPEIPPVPNPKDKVENVLHAWVCAVSRAAGQDRLRKAQLAIAGNWVMAEQVLGIRVLPRSDRPESPVPPPVRITSSAAPAQAACYPKTSGGNCYRAGEFCRKSDLGSAGVAGNGERIRCEASGSRNRWEPA
jgi:hypothetical protein